MDIKDDVVRLYVKRFVIPKALILDKPGFVDFRISGKTNVFARQMLVPEDFFVELERAIVKKYGDRGRAVMYSIGKRFGYSFSQLGRFENIKDHPGEGVRDWIIIASKFVEGTYASSITQSIDVGAKSVDFTLKNFIICRKLGYDMFLATGGAAGVIAWLLQDPSIEGYYYNSKFDGDSHVCKVLCAPSASLKGKKFFKETNLEGLNQDVSSYNKFNEEVEVRYTKSFSDYLDAKVFSYEQGIIRMRPNGERIFLMEVTGMYLLELMLKKSKMDADVFETARSVGMGLFGKLNSNVQSALELMTALGWGEVITMPGTRGRMQVIVNHFPWTGWYKEIDFLVIGGLLSGVLSEALGRDIRLGRPQVDMHDNHLALLFKEG